MQLLEQFKKFKSFLTLLVTRKKHVPVSLVNYWLVERVLWVQILLYRQEFVVVDAFEVSLFDALALLCLALLLAFSVEKLGLCCVLTVARVTQLNELVQLAIDVVVDSGIDLANEFEGLDLLS